MGLQAGLGFRSALAAALARANTTRRYCLVPRPASSTPAVAPLAVVSGPPASAASSAPPPTALADAQPPAGKWGSLRRTANAQTAADRAAQALAKGQPGP